MAKRNGSHQPVRDETAELRNRLAETEETLHAIRQYLVDAFVINRENGAQVVTLSDANFPYRMMVESMNEGAVTLIPDGTIFYSNQRFAKMVGSTCEKLIGVRFQDFILPEERQVFEEVLSHVKQGDARGEFSLKPTSGNMMRVQFSMYELADADGQGIALIATDISERVASEEKIRWLASKLTKAEQEERQRISQILHDDLQQRLFAIKAQLMLIRDASTGKADRSTMTMDLTQVESWLGEAISITRGLSVDLSPIVLQDKGLAEALAWLAAHMKEQYGLDVSLQVEDSSMQLDDYIRILLFQAVRELLFNVVKHSGTLQATVTVEQTQQRAHIIIKDEGKGFDAAAVMENPEAAHGLLSVQNRLNLMGLTMEVNSAVGSGTTVVLEAPLQARQNR